MNTENVISLEAVSAELLPFRHVTMTANGVDYAGPYDRAIGYTLPGDLNRDYPSIHLFGWLTESTLGNGTAVVRGDELEQAADGKLVKKTTGNAVAVAVEDASADGERFRAVHYGAPVPTTAPST